MAEKREYATMGNAMMKFIPFRNGFASRCFFIISHARNRRKRNKSKRPEVFLRITKLNDRHLYLLAEFFIQAGYFVYIIDNINKSQYYNNDPYYFYIFHSQHIKYCRLACKDPLPDALLCCDHEVDPKIASLFSKVLMINYDIDLPPNTTTETLFLPYPMHPNVYRSGQVHRIPELRDSPKRVGIFFAGNLKGQYGQTSRLLRHYIPRRTAIDLVLRRFKEKVRLFTSREALLRALQEEDLAASIVVFDATTERLSREEWFPVLAQSRFFLALPGVIMPTCHNGVEAMALGVVPILGYGQLFSPRLQTGSVCLGYVSETDLTETIEVALAMDDMAYARLRKRTMEHFDRHMVPGAFLSQLLRGHGRKIEIRYPAEFISEDVAKAASS
jgi:hypothetical protein